MTVKRTTSSQAGAENKKSRKQITLKEKLEVLRRLESGEKTASIVKSLGLGESTIRTIRANADKIKASVEAGSSSASYKVTRVRSILMEKMEKLLRLWIEDQNHRHMPLSMAIIQLKAMSLFNDLKAKGEVESNRDKTFSASNGWFFKFKGRHSLHNIKFTGESASADQAAASIYPADPNKIVEDGQYSPQQIFNADETGLFWKKMPVTTNIASKEKVAPGLKAAKEDPETPTPKSLTIKGLEESFKALENVLKYYEENDVDSERSQRVGRKINDAVECYRELYKQKKKTAAQPSAAKVDWKMANWMKLKKCNVVLNRITCKKGGETDTLEYIFNGLKYRSKVSATVALTLDAQLPSFRDVNWEEKEIPEVKTECLDIKSEDIYSEDQTFGTKKKEKEVDFKEDDLFYEEDHFSEEEANNEETVFFKDDISN